MPQQVKDVKRTYQAKERSPIRIVNISNQMIPIQLAAEGVDFFRGQQQIQLQPGKDILIDERYLVGDQATNLAERGMLKLIKSDSDA